VDHFPSLWKGLLDKPILVFLSLGFHHFILGELRQVTTGIESEA
jgi:hypothetical protein